MDLVEQANGHSMILGGTGFGKSFNEKKKIFYKVFLVDSDVVIFDPEGEYTPLVESLGGQVIYLGVDDINIMELPDSESEEGVGGRDIIGEKCDYIISFFEAVLDESKFNEAQKSIADRCLRHVLKLSLQNYYERPATLTDWFEELRNQPEKEAAELALSLERHIKGSFNCFAQESSVKRSSRIICYNMATLPKQMKNAGMMVALADTNIKILDNFKRGRITFVDIDEGDFYFKHESSRILLEELFETVRKKNGILTLMIQEIDKILKYSEARTMLNMCNNVVIMHQEEMAAEDFRKLYKLSEKQYQYLINALPGQGINKIGSQIYCFDERIPKDSWLYKIINTDKRKKTS